MTMKKGKDLLLKAGDGGAPESFITLGAARTTSVLIENNPVDITSLNSKGFQELQVKGGIQNLEISVEGIFKDGEAEDLLRSAAFNRELKNYQLIFPNGEVVEGVFLISQYQREGSYNGLEMFSLKLLRTGE